MSLLATSFRFEKESSKGNALQKAMGRQASKVKEDEKYSDRANEEYKNSRVNEIAKWSESLEEASQRRRVKREIRGINEEVRLAGCALVKVRRAQLKKLLEDEHKQYEEELVALGKAFYVERI
eukprot:gene3196-3669_t